VAKKYRIPVRYELLINGQLPAATLPEPQGSGAVAAGAIPVVDDTTIPELSASVLTFSTKALDDNARGVRKFLEAWEMAVKELNSNPDNYRDVLIEIGRVPESIQGTFQMPPYPEAGVPSREQIADTVAWSIEKGIITQEIPYERLVDDSFLP
jgi:NitT/TauT family transport system substrate-binding protein